MTKSASDEAREIVAHFVARRRYGPVPPGMTLDGVLESYITAAIAFRDEEIERLRAVAKSLSDALLRVRPLGGSELFRRFDDATFYADPDYCGRLIEQLHDRQHEACKEAARERKARLAAESRLAEARKVIEFFKTDDGLMRDLRRTLHFTDQGQEIALERRNAIADRLLSAPSPEPSKDVAGEHVVCDQGHFGAQFQRREG